jgi:hypothetical protein
MESLLVIIVIFWVLPILLTDGMARKRRRPNGWLWGAVLGWIGVFIVAVMSPAADHELSALEREVRLAELRRKQAELNGAE